MQNSNSTIAETIAHVNISENDALRFWAKVNKNGPTMPHMKSPCWVWVASRKAFYGALNIRGKMETAHRISWVLHNGAIPKGGGDYRGMCVCHHCDNPLCVNPNHLFLGSHLDNMRDKKAKGRHNPAVGGRHSSRTRPERMPRGESHGVAKLKDSEVLEMRSMYSNGGVTLKTLAAKFNICIATASLVIRRVRWTHL